MRGHNMKDETKEINKTPASSKRTAMRDMLTLNIIYKASDMMADNVPDEVKEGTQPGTTVEEARNRAEKAFCDCVNEIIETMLKGLETVTQDEITKTMRYILTHDVGEQLAREGNRLREFYRSNEWAELKKLFPELLEEDGASILFTGIYAPIIENLPELKQKIAEHEKQTGQKLTFLDLMDVEPKESLLKKFLQEIWGQDPEQAQAAIESIFSGYNMTVPNNKASKAVARMSKKNQIADPITRVVSVNINGVKMEVGEGDTLSSVVGIRLHKLLTSSQAALAAANNYSKSKNCTLKTLTVYIPEEEYMQAISDSLIKKETHSEEEDAKEKSRIKNLKHKLRGNIRADLETLLNTSFTFEDKVRGKKEDFAGVHPFGAAKYKDGMMEIEFTLSWATYAMKSPQTQYPIALMKLPEKYSNAYNMGIKIAEHYNIDDNAKWGTESRLKVDTLLKCTDLKGIEEVKKSRNSWSQKIKDPFEKLLNRLKGVVISDWWYTSPGGARVGKNEVSKLSRYIDWINLNVEYAMLNPEDHTERRQRRQDEREERKQRGSKKPEKTKTGV